MLRMLLNSYALYLFSSCPYFCLGLSFKDCYRLFSIASEVSLIGSFFISSRIYGFEGNLMGGKLPVKLTCLSCFCLLTFPYLISFHSCCFLITASLNSKLPKLGGIRETFLIVLLSSFINDF